MNALAKPRIEATVGQSIGLPALGRQVPMTPASLARWATELDSPSVFEEAPGNPLQAALVDRASDVAEQTFDLLLALPAHSTDDCLAQLIVLTNRLRLAAESGDPADVVRERVCALSDTLESTTIALAKIVGADPTLLGAVLFFHRDALAVAGFPPPPGFEDSTR
jgi:hypothetical protein